MSYQFHGTIFRTKGAMVMAACHAFLTAFGNNSRDQVEHIILTEYTDDELTGEMLENWFMDGEVTRVEATKCFSELRSLYKNGGEV